MGLSEDFLETVARGLVGKTLQKASRWATNRRTMGSPFPGPYGFTYHPWCKEIHDATCSNVTAMKAAQMGITEVAINRAFYTIDILREDVLYVLPTAQSASDFAKARFNSALSYSPYLKSLFTDTNTVGLKQAGGTCLYIRGSRGDSNLVSIPVSTLILDEVDRMDQKQIWLALERLSGHIKKSVWSISTPTVPKHGVHVLFLQGTQEHYRFKCPHCSKRTELLWPDCIEICGESITDPDCERSHLLCMECKHPLNHETKPEWLSPENAIWEPTIHDCNKEHRSFYINQLYSYTRNPGEIVKSYFQGLMDEAAEIEFNNSKLGIPFVPEGGQVTDIQIENCKRPYSKRETNPEPGSDRLICMGIDQGKVNHVVVVEYFVTGDLGFDPNAATTAKVLWEGKLSGEDFETLDPLMRQWQVYACVIDADPQINDARRFARRFPGYVYLCRYRRGVTGKETQLSEEDSGAPVVTVDRTNWLDATLGRFHSQRIELPIDISLEFRENVKNLARSYEKDELNNPKATYLNTGPDHFAHALNYAEIALPLAAGVGGSSDVEESLL